MPVHRRARFPSRELEGDAAYSVVGITSILEDVACHRSELNLLGRLFSVELDGHGSFVRHFDGGSLFRSLDIDSVLTRFAVE